MTTCGVCNQPCASEGSELVVRCAGICNRVYHCRCIKDDVEGKKKRGSREWWCKDCRTSSSTNSSTQSTPAELTKEFLVRVLDQFKEQVFNELKVFRVEMAGLSSSVQFISDKLDTTNTLMTEIKSELTAVKKENAALREMNVVLSSEMAGLKDRLRSLEQYTRKNNIEISGVPVTPKENIAAIVKDVGAAIGMEVQDSHVSAAHRIPNYNKERIPSIVFQFTNRVTKDSWLAKYKEKKTVTANQVNSSFPHNRVYVNEHLSPENKLFLAKLKQKGKEVGYTYVWSREGKFFVRRAPGEKCLRVNGYDELNSLK